MQQPTNRIHDILLEQQHDILTRNRRSSAGQQSGPIKAVESSRKNHINSNSATSPSSASFECWTRSRTEKPNRLTCSSLDKKSSNDPLSAAKPRSSQENLLAHPTEMPESTHIPRITDKIRDNVDASAKGSQLHSQFNKNSFTGTNTNTNTNSNNIGASTSNPSPLNTSSNNGGGNSGNSGTIIGHYELKKTLGKGNFSTVKLAQHKITQHLVAIKVVKTSVLSEDNLMKINREIDVLKKLGKHENVVRLYQVMKTKRYFMLVTEYCANGELYDYLVKNGKLSEANSCNYFLQILSAIEYLHDHNVVHRDLKAENLLLTDEFRTIKIADFGFANYYKPDDLLSTWCGSPPYAAPELFKGLEYVGPPVDIWSMGVVLYVMVCGSLPFDGHNLVYLKGRVLSGKFRIPYFMSTDCEGLIRGMLRLDPERRFSIRQIRSHCWTLKHANSRKENSNEQVIGSQQVVVFNETSSSNNSSCPFETKDLSSSLHSNSIKSLDKNSVNNNNRGQSLDFEEDKKKATEAVNEDSVMTCLSGSANDEKSSSRINQKDLSSSSTNKPALMKNLVNTEIANAVSNMSLDSNTSAMSVSQSMDTTSTLSNQGSGTTTTEDSRSNSRKLNQSGTGHRGGFGKENSIDDQIIDFMIDNLKIADGQSLIRQSIADDKYDDLHAIYRLLKDQPRIVLEALSSAKFKIPSLPLISLNKQQSVKKPSITTGFFNPPNQSHSKLADTIPAKNLAPTVRSNGSAVMNGSGDKTNAQDIAINLVTHTDLNSNPSKLAPKQRLKEREMRSEDNQTWNMPPQLFLTPPCENNRYSSLKSETFKQSEPDEAESPTTSFNREIKQVVARRSFDSTVQQFVDSSPIPGSSTNKLALTNCARQCLWDSSILDTLGVSTPPPTGNQNLSVRQNDNSDQSFSSIHGDPKEAMQIVQNIAGITTNLPQIGANSDAQNTINPNLLLAQLNSLALSAAVTQSSMLAQCNTNEQRFQTTNVVKFTPNNLLNQNYNVMNNLAMQNNANNPGVPNLNLLDPSGLISGLERRASDGQASYSSLTTTNDVLAPMQSGCDENSNTCQGSANIAAAFLSSSSNQLSSSPNSSSQQNPCNLAINAAPQFVGLTNDHQSLSNNPIMVADVAARRQIMADESRSSGQDVEQMNPLDLTKGTKSARQLEKARLSFGGETYAQLSDPQQKQSSQQRSHSTTSASVVFQHLPTSATTSPRSSLFISTNVNPNVQLPYCQVSPSSISLTGGGPGHLSTRRKRHSLENEPRGHHHKALHSNHYHQYPTAHPVPSAHLLTGYNESSRSLRQNPTQQYLQYPMSSHIGQLRNFAQTFSYKKFMKKQDSSTICEPATTFAPYSSPQADFTSMEFNNNHVPGNENLDK